MSQPRNRVAAELDRAVGEIRSTLSRLAKMESLPACLMSMAALMDRIEISITETPGESAFEMDQTRGAIHFRTRVLSEVIERAESVAAEAEMPAGPERRRVGQVALNLLLVHELLHVQQNFPDFGTVQKIKAGIAKYGLPMLDLGADTAAAWICAKIEADKTEDAGAEAFLKHYVNCLIQAHVIGAFIFDVEPAEKKQRALGLLMSAVLVQAKLENRLVPGKLYSNWEPGTPVLAFDLAAAKAFNAIVIDRLPGLLVDDQAVVPVGLVREIWDSVGRGSVLQAIELVARAFAAAGVIGTPQVAEDGVRGAG